MLGLQKRTNEILSRRSSSELFSLLPSRGVVAAEAGWSSSDSSRADSGLLCPHPRQTSTGLCAFRSASISSLCQILSTSSPTVLQSGLSQLLGEPQCSAIISGHQAAELSCPAPAAHPERGSPQLPDFFQGTISKSFSLSVTAEKKVPDRCSLFRKPHARVVDAE